MTHEQLSRPVLTIDEAAEYLRVSRWTIYKLINNNQLRTAKIGRRRLVSLDALADCLESLTESQYGESAA